MDLKYLKDFPKLAQKCLENTSYAFQKELIHDFFKEEAPLNKQIVMTQLTIIDSCYSTNMSRRYYAIEEIAEAILKIAHDKNRLKQRFIQYVDNKKNLSDLDEKLFDQRFGYTKTGKRSNRANSLITKYAYFVTDFNFPIYDSIVKEMYPYLCKKCFVDNGFKDFIFKMTYLLNESGISSYDELDMLLWLMGKIDRGNYSLILEQDKYLLLVKKIIGLDKGKSKEVGHKIKKFIYNNIDNLSDVFSEEQIKMIKFVQGKTNTEKVSK